MQVFRKQLKTSKMTREILKSIYKVNTSLYKYLKTHIFFKLHMLYNPSTLVVDYRYQRRFPRFKSPASMCSMIGVDGVLVKVPGLKPQCVPAWLIGVPLNGSGVRLYTISLTVDHTVCHTFCR